MVNVAGKPIESAYSRRKRMNTEWKVPIHRRRALRSPTMAATRSFISVAAFLVKVRARIRSAGTPFSIRYAIREVRTRVFPDPAPATMRTGPSTHVTAFTCSGFKSRKISVSDTLIIVRN